MWYDVAALTVWFVSIILVQDLDTEKILSWKEFAFWLPIALYVVAYPCYVLVSLAYWVFK
jgi:uncharacterized membrane protein